MQELAQSRKKHAWELAFDIFLILFYHTMVQGGFFGGLNNNFYGNYDHKTEANFGPGFNLGGTRTGIKEEAFLPRVGGDLISTNHGGAVKIDVVEPADEERSPSQKRTKYYQMQGSPVTRTTFSEGLSLHPLEEPSPLGLTLKKTPSFIELIQMNLSQANSAVPLVVNNSSLKVGRKKDSAARGAIADKHKASNFPALLLRIGSWERTSRYEGDLVAKCYFAKRKLVWEILEGGLKSKIEIQWSNISSLKASFPNNEPATLEVEVLRPPLFYKETDPQPRKHTVWQATSDFTGGQASIRRRHLLQFAEGLLERHYEKLLQCDHRLSLLSKEGIMGRDSPYFDSSGAVFEDQNEQSYYGATREHKSHFFPQFDHLKNRNLPPLSGLPGTGTPRVSPPFSSLPGTGTSRVSPLVKKLKPHGRVLDAAPQDTPSPCSVMDSRATEESGISDADDFHVNVTTKRNQVIFTAPYGGLGNQGSDAAPQDTPSPCSVSHLSEKKNWQAKILDEITQHLLGDSFSSDACDEQKVIARVNSMYSLIEKDISAVHASNANTKSLENSRAGYGLWRVAKGKDDGQVCERNDDMMEAVLNRDDRINSQVNVMDDGYMHCKISMGIPRQDSFGDLLVNVPRVASFPRLYDSSDEFITSAERPETAGWKPFQ